MAVEKGLVLTAIEAKLKGKSLSKNFKENLATKWADKIEDEAGIEAYIADREDLLLEASSEADRRAVAAAKKAKEEAEKAKTTTVEDDGDIELPSDTPDWAKALMKQNQMLAQKVQSFESQQKSQTIQERFRKDERISALKGLPDSAFKGRIPKSEEEYDNAVEEFVNDWKPFLEKHKLGEQGGDQPASGTGAAAANSKDVKPLSADQAKAIAKSMGSYA
jgi:hypothetical protein